MALSSSPLASASLIISSICSVLSLPDPWSLISIFSFLFEALSVAVTVKIESSLMSKVTSIYGTPFLAGAIPLRSNLPRLWLCLVSGLSPSKTLIETVLWLSWYVEKTWDFEAGMVVPRGIIFAITLPTVSIPRDNGVTSINSTFPKSPLVSPPRIPP